MKTRAGSAEEDSPAFARLALLQRLVKTSKAPEIAVTVLLCATAAVWFTHAGPLPGTGALRRWPLAGSLVVLAGWLAVYGVLGLALLRHASASEARRLLFRLAAALLLLVVAGTLSYFTGSLAVFNLPYFKFLYLAVAAACCFGLLLAPETRLLWREAKRRPATALAAAVLLAMLAAAFSVGAVDMLLHIDGHWESRYALKKPAFLANMLLLGSLYLAVFALCGRLWTAILSATAAYFLLGLANLVKMTYMHAGVQPLDLLYLAEFMPQFRSTFGFGAVFVVIAICALLVLGMFASWRHPVVRLPAAQRAAAGVFALAVLIAASFNQRHAPTRDWLESVGIAPKPWDSVVSARRNGVLVEFFSYIPDAFIPEPADYSVDAIASVANEYTWGSPPVSVAGAQDKVTVIIYMIESLMDPLDLGFELTADPIPTIRTLGATHSSGYAIVPARFGESASSEFEVLTGMSTYFLPERSVAYKQYVKRRIPSLPCLLQERGYRISAVHADPMDFYSRGEVYEHLCFEHVRWLIHDPEVPRSANGEAPSDDAIVDAVIAEVEAADPAFVFAFPNSTHHPYNLDLYADADLDLADPSATPARAELKYYLNTLRVADAAVKKLIEHFSAGGRDVLIAVLGDHLPPLSSEALSRFYGGLDQESAALERMLKERRVPLVVWSSFEREKEPLNMSLNLLAPYLLAQAGIQSDGFLSFVDQFRRNITTLSRHIVGVRGLWWSPEAVPPEYGDWISDYRLLQHDALFGEAYLEGRLAELRQVTVGRVGARGALEGVGGRTVTKSRQ